MLPDEIVVAVRRLERRLLEMEAGHMTNLRRLEQKIESLSAELAALRKPPEPAPEVKKPAAPASIPSLIPAQVPRVFRHKTQGGAEFIIA